MESQIEPILSVLWSLKYFGSREVPPIPLPIDAPDMQELENSL